MARNPYMAREKNENDRTLGIQTGIWIYNLMAFVYILVLFTCTTFLAKLPSVTIKADHPCEKSIKSSYRASSHLSMIHDASYFGWIRIDGFEQSIIDVLKFVLNPCENWIMSERYLFCPLL